MEEKVRRTRKLLENKLHSRNLFKGIDIWTVPFVRHPGLYLKQTRKKLRQMDKMTSKLILMHEA